LGKKIEIPKGPRTIDLDILFYQDRMIALDDLTVPHPSALTRAFVLMPMAEIAPDYIPPSDHRTIAAIAAAVSGATCPAGGAIVRKKMGAEWACKR
jgi:2-amino-4-hydroxy-6-hydroxymethyldihydropteridine diphosphokinase